ncbi:hypothetical protein ABH922_004767 [Rhodococcus sp. 27YEA15]
MTLEPREGVAITMMLSYLTRPRRGAELVLGNLTAALGRRELWGSQM